MGQSSVPGRRCNAAISSDFAVPVVSSSCDIHFLPSSLNNGARVQMVLVLYRIGQSGTNMWSFASSKCFESIALYWWMQAMGTFTAHAAFLTAYAPFCITTKISKAASCNFRDTSLDISHDSSFLYIKQMARNSLYVLGSSSTRYAIY